MSCPLDFKSKQNTNGLHAAQLDTLSKALEAAAALDADQKQQPPPQQQQQQQQPAPSQLDSQLLQRIKEGGPGERAADNSNRLVRLRGGTTAAVLGERLVSRAVGHLPQVAQLVGSNQSAERAVKAGAERRVELCRQAEARRKTAEASKRRQRERRQQQAQPGDAQQPQQQQRRSLGMRMSSGSLAGDSGKTLASGQLLG